MSDGIGPLACPAGLRVKAQPMVRDEQAAGWIPLTVQHVDPLSIVTVEQRQGQHVIVAHRIADSKEILSCAITTDIKYIKATTSFHHWCTSDGTHLNGLAFSSCTAAERFLQLVTKIISSLATPDDIHHTESTGGKKKASEQSSSSKVPVVPPKRPDKPQSLASIDDIPPETPPPRLPVRTITPPVHSRAAAVSHSNRLCKSASPTLNNMELMGRQQLSPQLPPRPSANQTACRSKTHTVHRAVPLVSMATSLSHAAPAAGLSHAAPAAGLSHAAPAPVKLNQWPLGTRQGGAGSSSYNDYREYELRPPAKTEPVNKPASRCSTSSSVSTSDSLNSEERGIQLPIKGRRSRDNSCCYSKAKTRDSSKKLLCGACNEFFYECDNVRGACTAPPQGLDGSVGPKAPKKRSRARTFDGLLKCFPCLWCYKSSRRSNRKCSRDRRHGAKHVAVRGKSDPS